MYSTTMIEDELACDCMSEDVDRRSILRYGGISLSIMSGISGCLERSGQSVDAPNKSRETPLSDTTETQTTKTHSTASDDATKADTSTETDSSNSGAPSDNEEPKNTESPTDTEAPTDGWFIRPDSRPKNTPSELDCEESGVERFKQQFSERNLSWGSTSESPWELRVNSQSIRYGQTVRIRLRNSSNKKQSRGTENKHNIQIKTSAGWQEIRVRESPQYEARSSEAIIHQPGEEYIWEFKVREDTTPMTGRNGVHVCPDLQAARYRFIVYSIDPPLGISFDMTI